MGQDDNNADEIPDPEYNDDDSYEYFDEENEEAEEEDTVN
jgi:hypothetical protein